MRRHEIPIILDGSGTADTESTVPLCGTIAEIRCSSTGLDNESKTDITITRRDDGGSVLKLTNIGAPWSKVPQQPVVNQEGAAALYAVAGAAVLEEIPIDGYLRIQVAEGKANGKATIYVFVDDE